MADNRSGYGIVRAIAGGVVLLISVVAFGNIGEAAGRTGSICIKYLGQDQEDKKIPLSGVEFALYRVGTMENGEWLLTEEFGDSGVSLQDNTASGRRNQAEKLLNYALEQHITGTLKKTDESGTAVYDGLDEGLYMSAQTEQFVYQDKSVFISSPSLISIPSETNGEVTYEVIIEPKSERKTQEPPKETPKSPEKVKTGDESAVGVYGILLLICAGVVGSLVIYEIRRKAIIGKRQS